MEALDALAVAERDILARTAAPPRTRENSACSGDSGRFAPREPASRVVPPRSASGAPASRHARLALPVHRKSKLFRALSRYARKNAREWFVESATERSRSRRPVKLDFSWRTERARAGRARVVASATSIRAQRGYVAERPRAARGLSSHTGQCGRCHPSYSHTNSTSTHPDQPKELSPSISVGSRKTVASTSFGASSSQSLSMSESAYVRSTS